MHTTNVIVFASVIAAAGSIASADIVRVDEFSSNQFESFEHLNMGVFDRGEVRAFDNMGTLFSADNGFLHTTGAWSFRQRVESFDGDRLLGSDKGIGYRFDQAQHSFGGYFSSLTDDADGQIRFYAGNDLIGVDTLAAPTDSTWAWNGWSSDAAFDRVEIESNYLSKGYLLHDAIRIMSTQAPAPGGAALAFGGLLVMTRRKR